MNNGDQQPNRKLVNEALLRFPQGVHYADITEYLQAQKILHPSAVARILNPNNTYQLKTVALPWRNPDVVYVGPGVYIHRACLPRDLAQINEILDLHFGYADEVEAKRLYNSHFDLQLQALFDDPQNEGTHFSVMDAVKAYEYDDARLIQYILLRSKNAVSAPIAKLYAQKYREYRDLIDALPTKVSRKRKRTPFENLSALQQKTTMEKMRDLARHYGLEELACETCVMVDHILEELFNSTNGDLLKVETQLKNITKALPIVALQFPNVERRDLVIGMAEKGVHTFINALFT